MTVARKVQVHLLDDIDGGKADETLKFALDGVPVYPRSILISRPELGQDMLACMGDHDVCVLRGHGITVHGRSVEEATIRAIKLEALARVNWIAATAGREIPSISPDDKEFFRSRGGGDPSPLPVWRYYVTLLDRK